MNEHYTRAPHRASAGTSRHSAALLIDFDNVTMGVRSNLGQELRNFLDSDIIRGKVAVQRAYADWRRYPQYIVPLSEASVDLIFAPAYGSSKKNATDIRLAIDALELVFTRPEIETFILLSGDSDFSSLVLKLKEYGKYVIGVGLQESTSDILVQNCDEYYSYNRLSGLKSADEIQTEKHDPWELTTRAVTRMAERGDVMRSDRLKQVMLEMDPSFDERTAGFSRFNRFLGEAAQREGIVLRKRENGQYEVAPPAGASNAVPSSGRETKAAGDGERASRGRGRRGRRGGSGRGRGRSAEAKSASKRSSEPRREAAREPAPESAAAGDELRGAYKALARAVDDLSPGGDPVRDSMAKRKLLERDASFDERSYGFSKFSLFLRAAHEAGVIRMARHDDGNHYLTPAPDERGAGDKAPAKTGPVEKASGKKASAEKQRTEKEAAGGRGRSPFSAAAAVARKTLGLGRRRKGAGAREAESARPAEGSAAAGKAPAAGRATESSRETQRAPRSRPKSESQRPKSESSRPKPESRRPKSEAQRPKPESQRPKSKSPRPKPESRRPRAESRRPRAESQRPKPEQRRPKPEGQRSKDERRRTQPEAKAQPAAKQDRADASAGAKSPVPRRTLGRYRSGSRGRATKPQTSGTAGGPRIGPIADDAPRSGGAAKTSPGSSKPTAKAGSERAKAAGRDRSQRASGSGGRRKRTSAPAKPAGGAVGHMVRNYAGVGKRTAEVLVERFGDGVFDVIDSDPDRLTEVLSAGRAKIVRKARRAELES